MKLTFGSGYRIYSNPQDVNKTVDIIKKDLQDKNITFDTLCLDGENADKYRHKTIAIFTNDENGNDADLCSKIKAEFYNHFKIKAQVDKDLANELPPNTLLIGNDAEKFSQKVFIETKKRIGETSEAFQKFKTRFLDKFASEKIIQNAIWVEYLIHNKDFDTTTGQEK